MRVVGSRPVVAVVATGLILSVAGRAGAVPFNTNLLANPGFEDATLAPWTEENAAGATISISTDAHVGLQSAQVDYTVDFAGITQSVAIDPEDRLQDFRLSFVYKNPQGVTAIQGIRPVVGEFGPGGVAFPVAQFGWASTNWQLWVIDFTLTRSDTTALKLDFQGHTTKPGSFLVDEVSLMKVPEPTTALIFLAGAGLIRIRRRSA